MRRTILLLTIGVVLLLGAVTGFIIVPEHAPYSGPSGVTFNPSPDEVLHGGGWSQTAYDLARIGTWALLIVGLISVIVGLLTYWRPRPQ